MSRNFLIRTVWGKKIKIRKDGIPKGYFESLNIYTTVTKMKQVQSITDAQDNGQKLSKINNHHKNGDLESLKAANRTNII